MEEFFGHENPYRVVNQYLNNIFYNFIGQKTLPLHLSESCGNELGYYISLYIRDLALGTFVYWFTASLWHFVIYQLLGSKLFVSKNRELPTTEVILDQIQLAQSSIFLYAALPVFSEFLIESNLTKTYFYINDIGGWNNYIFLTIIYFVCVEFGIYWMHRTLHTNKFLYHYIHSLHHKYNKVTMLTPWASIAFNPFDGILQASPYVLFLFLIPTHYFTHLILLFMTGVWATNIHDSLVS